MLIRSKSASTVQRPSTAVHKKSNLKNNDNENILLSSNRETLNNLIPDLPSFSNNKNKSTALLYSKFITKGINTNKIDLVKQSFNMKKENLAYQKKNSLNYMKTIKSTVNSTKNQLLHQSIQKQNQEKSKYDQFFHFDEKAKVENLQINSFIRIKSAKKQIQNNETNHNLLNINSQKILTRPKSALSTPQTLIRNTRAQTAKNKKSLINFNPFTINYDEPKLFQAQRKVSAFSKIQQQKGFFVNHIQRNKRLLSASSKKNSVYLTGIDINNKMIQNENEDPKKLLLKTLRKKLSPQKYKQVTIEDFNQNDNQIYRKRVPLTERQIDQIKQKNKANAEFMKENMPNQYKKYVLYLQMKQNNMTQQDQALLSIDLDYNLQEFGQKNKRHKNSQQIFEQAKQYYQNYADLCDQALHHVNLYRKRQKIPKVTNQILNVDECQQLLNLENERILIEKFTPKNDLQNNRVTEIKQKIYQLVKKLNFFKDKSQEICKKIFNLQFKIQTVQEDQIIVKQDDKVNFIYVILNGSVVRKTKKQKIKQNDTNQKAIIQGGFFENTLFDGQAFGQPENKSDRNCNYEIVASQKVLIMKFPYFQYCKIFKQNSNIQERIKLLNQIFGNVPGCKTLKNENLQQLALELQPLQFEAKQIIFRKGETCQKLIIVASGKVIITNQHILKRQKKNPKDVKKRVKSLTKLNVNDFSIENLRRKNIKNYQILHQNQQQFVFYYQDEVKELINEDVINWQGFYYQQNKNLEYENNFITESSKVDVYKIKSNPFKLNFSLISKTDNTKIYLLDVKRLSKLPQFLKQTIDVKVNLVFQEQKIKKKIYNQGNKFCSIKKWDQFKQKLCNQIIGSKIKS